MGLDLTVVASVCFPVTGTPATAAAERALIGPIILTNSENWDSVNLYLFMIFCFISVLIWETAEPVVPDCTFSPVLVPFSNNIILNNLFCVSVFEKQPICPFDCSLQ